MLGPSVVSIAWYRVKWDAGQMAYARTYANRYGLAHHGLEFALKGPPQRTGMAVNGYVEPRNEVRFRIMV
jgi:hypothetical protein